MMRKSKPNCIIDNCDQPHKAKGYCRKHYWRFAKYGDPNKTSRFGKEISLDERINLVGWDVIDSGCWEWRGYRDHFNYPMIMFANQAIRVHRYVFELSFGKMILPGNVVMHSCDNPPCVNPDHLSQGTQADNIQDMVSKNRHRRGGGKLSEARVQEIRKRVAAGEKMRALERELNLGGGSVSRIVSRQTHAWVE